MSLSEMMFLGLLGLLVFGPRKLSAVGQQAGKAIAHLKAVSTEFRSQLETEIAAAGDSETEPVRAVQQVTELDGGDEKSSAIAS